MKVAEEKVRMAYALGGATCKKDLNDNRKIDLGLVNSDWDGYVLIGHGMNKERNNSYDLWYNGDHGVEKKYTRIMKIEEGWNLNHAVALFLNAIQMHISENKNKTE